MATTEGPRSRFPSAVDRMSVLRSALLWPPRQQNFGMSGNLILGLSWVLPTVSIMSHIAAMP
jgi:hypothetical protein